MKRSNTRWVAGQQARARAAKLLASGLLVAALGCQRKAPGPDECLAFAKVWVESRHLDKVPVGALDPFE